MAKFLQEITVWKDGSTANHLYVLDDSKSNMIAFRQTGQSDFKTFKAPIRIDTRGRKFVEVKNTFGLTFDREKPEGKCHTVSGSKGEQYTVVEHEDKFTCTCSGFKFRGQCKHIDYVKTTRNDKT